MRFSIIIPIYNVEKYLQRCLNSILNQTYQDYEMILIDDGSTDGSGKICDEYAKKYNKINVIHQQNQGLSGARNTGLNVAKGEWVIFVDSEDWIESNMLQTLNKYIEMDHAELYVFNGQTVDENEEILATLLFTLKDGSHKLRSEKEKFNYYSNTLLLYKIGWEVWSRIYRRDLITKYNLYFVPTKEIFAEDYLFTFQYMLYVQKIGFINQRFYNYFQRTTSLLHSADKSTILPRLYNLAEKAYETVDKNKFPYFNKHFGELYFIMIDFHITYPLYDMPKEKLEKNIEELSERCWHRRWLKKVRKRKIFEYYLRKNYLEYRKNNQRKKDLLRGCMRAVKWTIKRKF